MSEGKSYFHLFDWSYVPADPFDRVMGQLVSDPLNLKHLETCDTVIFGIPFDDAVLGRKGAADGPRAIREAFQRLKAHNHGSGEVVRTLYDLGDFIFPAENVASAHEEVERAARHAKNFASRPKNRARVIALGGDHSLSYPCAIPYLEQHREKLVVINLDAHLDVRVVPQGQPHNSGTSFGRLLERGLKNYIVIGARDFHTSPEYVKRATGMGARIISANEVFASSGEAIARKVLAELPKECAAIYLSVDLDVADASVVPGVSAPTPGGLMAHQIFDLVRTICDDERVVACDLMELAPNLEDSFSDRSARLAAACLAYMVSSS
ncbi:MAG TPA: agmatinase family protein [Planctomycetota bacterium]|nr:agmatinase family protein [Planctomycetota bacterium]